MPQPRTVPKLWPASLHTQVDQVFSPGLVQITWSSLNVQLFINRVTLAIEDFGRFVKQVSVMGMG